MSFATGLPCLVITMPSGSRLSSIVRQSFSNYMVIRLNLGLPLQAAAGSFESV